MFDVKAYTVGVSTQRKGMVDLRRAVLSTNSWALLCTMFTCTLLWFHKSCCSFNANNEATCDLWIKSATVASLLNTKNSSDPCHHLERGKLISTSEMQLPRGKYWAAGTATKSTSQTSNTSREKKKQKHRHTFCLNTEFLTPHEMKDLLACQDLWIHSCNENKCH